ncbi:hypothetical protein MMARV_C016P1, partial [viral metagenome]
NSVFPLVFHFVNLSVLCERGARPHSPFLFPRRLERAQKLLDKTTCIPVLLVALGFLSTSQAERFYYVKTFSDLPKTIRDGILRSRLASQLVRVYPGHVEAIGTRTTSLDYRLVPLRTLIIHHATEQFLATPFATDAEPTLEYASPSLPALGGVRAVLTQLATSTRASALSNFWNTQTFTTQAVEERLQLDVTARRVDTLRTNNYIRHFPDSVPNPRLPAHFSDQLRSTIAAVQAPNAQYAQAVPVQFTRNWERRPLSGRSLREGQAGLSGVLADGDYSKEGLARAEQSIAINRFLDTRGNRTIPGWEADQWNRWSGLTSLFGMARTDNNYLQVAYRLIARYYAAIAVPEINGAQIVPANIGTNVPLTPLSSQLPPAPVPVPGAPPVPPVNPEAPLFTQAAFLGLQRGTKQFVDAEGLSEDELVELLSAIVPLSATPGANNLPRLLVTRGQEPAREMFLGPTRYAYDNGVDEVFVHFGNHAPPNMAAIANQVHRAPSAPHILSVLRYLAMRHGAAQDIDAAIEILLTRIVLYSTEHNLLGLRDNAPNDRYIHADGHYQMHLPRAKTAMAYFDAFFVPSAATGELPFFASLSPAALINNGVLLAQARAVALNWATTSWSMIGRNWQNMPGAEPNVYIRNHIDVWLRRYSSDILNLWSSCHNNALALQYGFSISPVARSTEAGVVVPWWRDYQAAYLSNPYHELWMMDMIPSHQLLPYFDDQAPSHVSWPAKTPFPIADRYSFANNLRVELSRDLPAEVGRTWMADGGSTANGQHMAAVGTTNGFRFEGNNTPPVELARWRVRHAYQFPQNPATQAITWMGAPTSPFADFILPGSMPTCNIEANTAYSHGIRASAGINQPEANHLGQLWFDAARQVGKRSLMVNYISPFPDRRELASLQDYSIVIWKSGNSYSGMSLVPQDFSPVRFEDTYRPNNKLPMPSYTRPTAADVSDTARNARTTARTPKPARTQANNVFERLAEFKRADRPRSEHEDGLSGEISYQPKYPVDAGQIPQMQTYQGASLGEHATLNALPDKRSFADIDKAELIDAVKRSMAVMAKLQNSPLFANDFDVEEARQQQEEWRRKEADRIARRPAPAPRPVRKPRVAPASRPLTDFVKPTVIRGYSQVQGQVPASLKGKEPVKVNDAPAVEAQSNMLNISRPRSVPPHPPSGERFVVQDPFEELARARQNGDFDAVVAYDDFYANPQVENRVPFDDNIGDTNATARDADATLPLAEN